MLPRARNVRCCTRRSIYRGLNRDGYGNGEDGLSRASRRGRRDYGKVAMNVSELRRNCMSIVFVISNLHHMTLFITLSLMTPEVSMPLLSRHLSLCILATPGLAELMFTDTDRSASPALVHDTAYTPGETLSSGGLQYEATGSC